MRIAMVSEHASPLAPLGGIEAGGQNVHVAELAAALVRAGHDVTVYTRLDDPALPERVDAARGVTVVHVPAGPPEPMPRDVLLPFMGAFGRYLAEAWEAARPDVVHAHFWMSGLAAVSGAEALGVPVVLTYHALGAVKHRHQRERDTSPPQRIRLERALGRSTARIVATCSDEVLELARMGVPRDRVTVVPCGVDPDLFSVGGPVLARSERPRLVAVGRLVERKGFETAVTALRGLPDAELLIAGGPPAAHLNDDAYARRLLRHAAAAGVGGRVRLLGQVSRADLPALLRSADAVLCTPWYEPFGIVALEAMACGVPVVASSVGGFLDTVVDGVTGLLVPPRQPASLASAIRRLLTDPVLQGGAGVAGADRARSRYSWDRVATDTSRVYAQVVRRQQRPAAGGQRDVGRTSGWITEAAR
ncbi:MAG TPA: glycosyltransferase [Cryptosporangiaceae bacterium]|nr:glycosyltransferase [Cryptosporangiaceae bacterium]